MDDEAEDEILRVMQPYKEKIAENPYFKKLTAGRKRTYACIYFMAVWKNRDYISLEKLAKEAGITVTQAEHYLMQFIVDREVPRLYILEEMEG